MWMFNWFMWLGFDVWLMLCVRLPMTSQGELGFFLTTCAVVLHTLGLRLSDLLWSDLWISLLPYRFIVWLLTDLVDDCLMTREGRSLTDEIPAHRTSCELPRPPPPPAPQKAEDRRQRQNPKAAEATNMQQQHGKLGHANSRETKNMKKEVD